MNAKPWQGAGKRLYLQEVGTRDGLQAESTFVPTEEKVALTRSTDVSAKDAAHQLAEQLGADVVQTIGRTCTLYRENPDLERKKGAPPPWR